LAKGTCSAADNENCKTWTEQISKGNLTTPSDELFKSTKILEDLFNKFHENGLSREPKIIKTVTEMLLKRDKNHVKLPLKVAKCLVRTRTFIKLNYLNKKILELATKNKIEKQRKLKKFGVLK